MATPTAQIDAQGQNDIERNTRQWKDLDLEHLYMQLVLPLKLPF